jgi:hypothetical protein
MQLIDYQLPKKLFYEKFCKITEKNAKKYRLRNIVLSKNYLLNAVKASVTFCNVSSSNPAR